ncbi:MAG: ATP-binding protein [Candidatus Heimdallarchaeota archaeon]
MQQRLSFPFSAIVSSEKLKLAILINAINPKIGGVLIQGPKGSGKTTIVRSLTAILPKINVVKGCPFNCNPEDPTKMCENCTEKHHNGESFLTEERDMRVVDLPLGATEDRVIGSLNVEKAIKHGIEALEPGILAEANQNILYVDEINLLPDHLADDLLDAAATGWNVVEREGISVRHPSFFIFIGTMNPEEGQLRPQLLDRFSLSVSVEPILSAKQRMEVVKKNLDFEANPQHFLGTQKIAQEELIDRIMYARKILSEVEMPENLLEVVCRSCIELEVDGMRPDIVISKAAATLAAFEKRRIVTPDDIAIASELTLRHRTRKGGFLEPASRDEISKIFMAKIKKLKYVEKPKRETENESPKEQPKGRTAIWAKQKLTEEQEKMVKKKRVEEEDSFPS